MSDFKPNWLAIFIVVFFLIVVGWLLGKITEAPSGSTIHCPSEASVEIVRKGGEVIAFCSD